MERGTREGEMCSAFLLEGKQIYSLGFFLLLFFECLCCAFSGPSSCSSLLFLTLLSLCVSVCGFYCLAFVLTLRF